MSFRFANREQHAMSSLTLNVSTFVLCSLIVWIALLDKGLLVTEASSIDLLPPELLPAVLNQLSIADIKNTRFAAKRFYEASHSVSHRHYCHWRYRSILHQSPNDLADLQKAGWQYNEEKQKFFFVFREKMRERHVVPGTNPQKVTSIEWHWQPKSLLALLPLYKANCVERTALSLSNDIQSYHEPLIELAKQVIENEPKAAQNFHLLISDRTSLKEMPFQAGHLIFREYMENSAAPVLTPESLNKCLQAASAIQFQGGDLSCMLRLGNLQQPFPFEAIAQARIEAAKSNYQFKVLLHVNGNDAARRYLLAAIPESFQSDEESRIVTKEAKSIHLSWPKSIISNRVRSFFSYLFFFVLHCIPHVPAFNL